MSQEAEGTAGLKEGLLGGGGGVQEVVKPFPLCFLFFTPSSPSLPVCLCLFLFLFRFFPSFLSFLPYLPFRMYPSLLQSFLYQRSLALLHLAYLTLPSLPYLAAEILGSFVKLQDLAIRMKDKARTVLI